MSFLDKLKQTADLWLSSEDKVNSDKGRDFEKFVARIFSSQGDYFRILDWTKDVYDKRAGINVESNKNPDLLTLSAYIDETQNGATFRLT